MALDRSDGVSHGEASTRRPRRPLRAALAALVSLLVWWGGIMWLDGAIAERLPYHQYEMVALLYPEVFYAGVPGWILASVQPSSVGVSVALSGWVPALAAGIGIGATRYAHSRGGNETRLAVGFVAMLFVLATVLEAIVRVVRPVASGRLRFLAWTVTHHSGPTPVDSARGWYRR